MQNIAAATCADTLIARWISRYGVPTQLTSDQGAHFILAVWAVLCQQLGIQLQLTTTFHPPLPRRI
jgi:transposase InsO family protein